MPIGPLKDAARKWGIDDCRRHVILRYKSQIKVDSGKQHSRKVPAFDLCDIEATRHSFSTLCEIMAHFGAFITVALSRHDRGREYDLDRRQTLLLSDRILRISDGFVTVSIRAGQNRVSL